MVNNQSADATMQTTRMPNTKCDCMSFFLKICGILFLVVIALCAIPLLSCALMQMERNLKGGYPPRNVTTPPVITLGIAHYIPLMAVFLVLGILLGFYVFVRISCAVHSPGKPKLKKIVFHAKGCVIPKGSDKKEEEAKPEKKSASATSESSINNYP